MEVGLKPNNSAVGLSAKLYEYKTMQVNDTSFEVRIRDDNWARLSDQIKLQE